MDPSVGEPQQEWVPWRLSRDIATPQTALTRVLNFPPLHCLHLPRALPIASSPVQRQFGPGAPHHRLHIKVLLTCPFPTRANTPRETTNTYHLEPINTNNLRRPSTPPQRAISLTSTNYPKTSATSTNSPMTKSPIHPPTNTTSHPPRTLMDAGPASNQHKSRTSCRASLPRLRHQLRDKEAAAPRIAAWIPKCLYINARKGGCPFDRAISTLRIIFDRIKSECFGRRFGRGVCIKRSRNWGRRLKAQALI